MNVFETPVAGCFGGKVDVMRMIVTTGAALLLACASTLSSTELRQAERAYARASHGPAQTYAQGDLYEARMALNEAEEAYQHAPRSEQTRALALEARRKAEIAESNGRVPPGVIYRAPAQGTRITVTAPQPQQTTRIAVTAPQPQPTTQVTVTDDAGRRAAEARARDAERERDAAEEKARAAEQRNADLERNLALIAEVHETERGLVVTLSGDVLFEFDRDQLLPPAIIKLGKLADALNKTDLKVAIEGHTDGVGTDGYNQELSYRRARSVRDFLASRGVAAERLEVAGFGKSRPIATNATNEGRAMNRRVEIIIEKAK
jgi:outer membrane protein OmpA-like peptidoglycan-associated protein